MYRDRIADLINDAINTSLAGQYSSSKSGNIVTATSLIDGETTDATAGDVSGETFQIDVVVDAWNEAKDNQTNYNAVNGENLTKRAARLTAYMADKAQDKTIKFSLRGVQNIANVENGLNQDISFSPAGGTLTVAIPSSSNQTVINLDSTLSLAEGQAAYFTIDRNLAKSLTDLTELTVSDISDVPLDENTYIFAYRLTGTEINLWNSQEINNYQDALGEALQEITTVTS